jgi:hypothetical protein
MLKTITLFQTYLVKYGNLADSMMQYASLAADSYLPSQ